MTRARRIVNFFIISMVAVCVVAGGIWFELNVFNWVDVSSLNPSLTHAGVFFGVLNLNLLILSVFVFLVFKSAVRLAVDRKKGIFGSSLRTKLVTAFVFFALLPTIILLYMTSKFVNANFDKWMPASLVEVSSRSASAERNYQEKILRLLEGNLWSGSPSVRRDRRVHETLSSATSEEATQNELSGRLSMVDFRLTLDPVQISARPEFEPKMMERIKTTALASISRLDGGKAKWFSAGNDLLFALRRISSTEFIGVIAPPTIHSHWQLLEREFSTSGPGVEILRLSYYLMLAVLTLLILFSATWLGFTIAREYAEPMGVLAQATDRVAQGDYSVEIDEIISDDDMGRLAQSFRSMVHDLRAGHESAARAAAELALKAQELQKNSEYNAFLLEHVNSGVVVLSRGGTIKEMNEQAERVFGLSFVEAVGKPAVQVFEKDFVESVLNEERTLEGMPYRGVLAGREKHLQIKISTHGDSASPDRVVLIEDLTELARAQRVAAWRDVARRVAHEIKNPLTPITLGVQRLQRRFQSRFEGPDAEVFQDSVRTVLDSTQSIRRLVEEFIQFARMPQALMTKGNIIEATQLALSGFQFEEGNSVLLTVSLVDDASASGRALSSREFHEVASRVNAYFDKDQIVRMLGNLVANAIEACSETKARVDVFLKIDLLQSVCEFRVVDEGPGIPKEIRTKIFEPYFSTRRRGSGLGLPIVRQIVAEHRGEITVLENQPLGTEFSVTLPILSSNKVTTGNEI